MKRILPQFGISFVEIPRFKNSNNDVISATRVRQLIEEGRIDEIRNYVPITTYNIIKNRYTKILKG